MSYFENIKVFVRVVELGNLSAAGRDMRISPAVASNRVKELEKYLGVRLFNRTTRQLTPTEHGQIFYKGANRIIQAVDDAEASIASVSGKPKGTIRVSAPLGFGRRYIASGITYREPVKWVSKYRHRSPRTGFGLPSSQAGIRSFRRCSSFTPAEDKPSF